MILKHFGIKKYLYRLENFVNFSCMIFWAQNGPIPPDKYLSKFLDQNVLILLASNR